MFTGMLTRVDGGSLRQHFLTLLGAITAGLVVTGMVSAGTVVWAAQSLRDQADRITSLQVANRDVLQDVTDAQVGLLRFRSTGGASDLAFFERAGSRLQSRIRNLEELAEDDRMTEAVTEQERAIDAWLRDYADIVVAAGSEDAVTRAVEVRGQSLFDEIRTANAGVDEAVDSVTADIRDRIGDITLAALVVVALLPVLAVVGVVLLARGNSATVVAPLTAIAAVLERLRAGDRGARAAVEGPQEVRQIAEGLNSLTEENLRASEVEADVLSQLEMIDRVRTDLVSTVSHELRTPLASMQGYLELLQDDLAGVMTPQQSSMMATVRRNVDRLTELITNLLALSSAEETELAVAPVDLRAIATEVATDLRLTASARDITIRTRHAAAPVVVLGDRSQLTRAVLNLVSNGVKFSRPGSTVELRVTRSGSEALLEVVDEGIGIPAADLPGLGSRFYRASNAVKAEIAGTGLGLRIVQTILDRHGGSLAVESVEGEGSTFTVSLSARDGALASSGFAERGDPTGRD